MSYTKAKITSYKPHLKKLASSLRKNSTFGERKLWQYLRKKQMLGYDFNRQKPLLNYIVDFYCIKLRLVIEIDGISHDELRYEKDQKRQMDLEALGLTVLRFSESDALKNIHDVLQGIENWILENTGEGNTPHSPLKRGEDTIP